MKNIFSLITWISFALLFVGCATAPKTAADSNASVAKDSKPPLAKGMSAEDVRHLWGEPVEVKPMEAPGSNVAEVWVYRYFDTVSSGTSIVGTTDVPIFDPFTGETRMVQEPRYEATTSRVRVTTELLMFNGQLTNWKRSTEASDDF